MDYALFFLFATVLLQWIILQEVAGFLVRPFHVSMIFLFISVLLDRNLLTIARDSFKRGYYFFVLVIFFLILEIISLFWSKRFGPGASGIFRQSLYIFMGFSLTIKAADMHSQKIIKTIFWGSLFGTVVFFATITIYLKYYNIDFIGDYVAALASRNLVTLVAFFAKVYLQLGGVEEWHTGVLRHLFSGMFITFALLFRAVTPSIRKDSQHKLLFSFLEILMYTASLLIVIMSLSRTAMLTVLTSFSLFFLVGAFTGKFKVRTVFPTIIIALFTIIFLTIVFDFNIVGTMVTMIWERFFLATRGYENRIDMYVDASNSINQYPFFGLGFGAESQEFGFQIHNFFLNAWFQLGISGFLLAILLYSFLVLYWLRQVISLIIRPQAWVLGIAAEPIMALPIFPLIRMLVGGSPFQSVLEWFPLGLFFGFVFANERILRQPHLQQHTVLPKKVLVS